MKNNNLNNTKSDSVFRDLARRYSEYNGYLLSSEASAATAEAPSLRGAGSLTHVRRRIERKKNARTTKAVSLMAALLIIAIVLPALLVLQPWAYKEIPLDFTLPPQFTIVETVVDRNITSYKIEDTRGGDDVVITLEKTKADLDTDGFTLIIVDGRGVYVKDYADYKLLIFKRNNVIYTLSCRHDINTLIMIYKNV